MADPVENERAPVIEPGYTLGSVTDKISSIVLTRPTSNAWFVGFATAFLTWVFLIFVAGSADRAYVLFGWSYQTQIELYRVLVFVAPVVAFWLAHRICVELVRNEAVAEQRHLAELEADGAAQHE